jgi:hypothetical protein
MRAPIVLETKRLQGPDSYVTIRCATVGELRQYNEEVTANPMGRDTVQVQFMVEHVVDWNWTDGEGVRLPLPKDDPTVLNRLSVPEWNLIDEAISSGDPWKLKN